MTGWVRVHVPLGKCATCWSRPHGTDGNARVILLLNFQSLGALCGHLRASWVSCCLRFPPQLSPCAYCSDGPSIGIWPLVVSIRPGMFSVSDDVVVKVLSSSSSKPVPTLTFLVFFLLSDQRTVHPPHPVREPVPHRRPMAWTCQPPHFENQKCKDQ